MSDKRDEQIKATISRVHDRLTDTTRAIEAGEPIDVVTDKWANAYQLASEVNQVIQGASLLRRWIDSQKAKFGK